MRASSKVVFMMTWFGKCQSGLDWKLGSVKQFSYGTHNICARLRSTRCGAFASPELVHNMTIELERSTPQMLAGCSAFSGCPPGSRRQLALQPDIMVGVNCECPVQTSISTLGSSKQATRKSEHVEWKDICTASSHR
eukprot:1983418-Amphidinium_carterae.2